MSTPAPPLLSLRNLTVRIGGAEPVGGISLDVLPGEVLGVVGESGSGKSLTMRAVLRLLPDAAVVTGQALWQGRRDLLTLPAAAMRAVRGREIAMVFQEPMTALNPVLPVGLQITESLGEHLGLRGAAAKRRAVELLDQVGIPDARRRLPSYPHEFSGGMRQRAMIAIALAAQPKLLLADEPTTALDVTIQDQILRLLLRLKDELSMSVVLVTHDLGVIAGTCDRVAVFYAGRVMETGPVDAVFQRPSHAYTLGLMRALPGDGGDIGGGDIGGDGQRRRRHAPRQRLGSIPGAPPDPRAMPPGCRFLPRCAFGISACGDADPPLSAVAPDQATACIRAGAVLRAARDMTQGAAAW